MDTPNGYTFKDAVNEFYEVEPLKKDFALVVAEKAFAKKGSSFNWDKLLQYAALVICIGSLGALSVFARIATAIPGIILTVGILSLLLLSSWKEFQVLRSRVGRLT